uniref:ATG13 domain-containing protein n=1 Tax=Schistocephalus solidus TaxID=70667 RepID=A0A183TRQ9_SCHSO
LTENTISFYFHSSLSYRSDAGRKRCSDASRADTSGSRLHTFDLIDIATGEGEKENSFLTVLLSACRDSRWEFLDGPDGFFEREQEIEVGIGFHLKQSVDDGVGDGGGLVEDTSEVLGPALQDLRLLGEQAEVSTAPIASVRPELWRQWLHTELKETPPLTLMVRCVESPKQSNSTEVFGMSQPSPQTRPTSSPSVGYTSPVSTLSTGLRQLDRCRPSSATNVNVS